MIYTPKYFSEPSNSARVLALVKTYNFATMIVTVDGAPLFSHLPFHYVPEEGKQGTLYAHMAQANPMARYVKGGVETTVLFQGPHAYISPAWYAPVPDNVPTWNYAVVHMHGSCETISDDQVAFDQMQNLVASHDGEFTLDLSEKDRSDMMRAICVFKIVVAKIDAKFKLSQNRSDFDQKNVIKHLKMGSVLDQETAKLMEDTKKNDS